MEAVKSYIHGFEAEDFEALDKEANGKWQVHDGEKWKFHLNSREQAVHLARRFGGGVIGKCLWTEQDGAERLNREWVNGITI